MLMSFLAFVNKYVLIFGHFSRSVHKLFGSSDYLTKAPEKTGALC